MARGGDGPERVVDHFDGQRSEGRDRVDATSREEDEAGAMGFAELEHVHRAAEVVFDELTGTGFAVDPGKDARVGGGVDDPVDGGKGFEVAGRTEVTMEEFDAELFEGVAIGLAAGADEIVEADEGVAGAGFGEGACEGAADKAAHTGDQDSHGGTVAKRGARGKRDFLTCRVQSLAGNVLTLGGRRSGVAA